MSDSTAPLDTPSAEALPRPRIRAGAALWGLVLTGGAGWVLWIASDFSRRAELLDTALTMSPLAWTVAVVVAVGSAIALFSLAAVIRRLQRPRP